MPNTSNVVPDPSVSIRGVTGNYLELLGNLQVELQIGSFRKHVMVYVVNRLPNNAFIIGRDLLQKFDCIIDYKQLTFSVGDTTIPLMKSNDNSNTVNKAEIRCAKSVVIPPLSQGYLHGLTKSKNRRRGRLFPTISGIATSCLANNPTLRVEDGIVNSCRGKVNLLVQNVSKEAVVIYRNSKIGSFSSIRTEEICVSHSSLHNTDSTFAQFQQNHDVPNMQHASVSLIS